ncbi:MAG: prephenate dehydrogenase/arogenate dehydrogenase family protein [Verrucomicrobiota bacterium]
MLRQISIIGPGLLGSSLSLAAKKHRLTEKVVAWSHRAETRANCLAKGICDAVEETPAKAVKGSDLVILCTPVDTIIPLLTEIQASLDEDAILTDVGSTKSQICRQAQGIEIKHTAFIGSHPMAGSDQRGMENARADLFSGATCFITPLDNAPADHVQRLVNFWENIGMHIQITSPEIHDEIVAHVSHLPHAIAAVLSKFLGEKNADWAQFAGGGLRDTSRIASGNPGLWKQIFDQNREEVIRAIEGFEDRLHRFKASLLNKEYADTQRILQQGKSFRDSLNSHTKNDTDG